METKDKTQDMDSTTIINKEEVTANLSEDIKSNEVIENFMSVAEKEFIKLENAEDSLINYELLEKLITRVDKLEGNTIKLTESNVRLEGIIREQNNTIISMIKTLNKVVEGSNSSRRAQADTNTILRDLLDSNRVNSVAIDNIDKSLSTYANNNIGLIKEYNGSVSEIVGHAEGLEEQYKIINKEVEVIKKTSTDNSKKIQSVTTIADRADKTSGEALDKATEHDSILNKFKGFGGLFSSK